MKLNLLLLLAALFNANAALVQSAPVAIIGDLCGEKLPPGSYETITACNLSCPLELDAGGNANAEWTIVCGGAIAIAANAGAFFTDTVGSPDKVIWSIGGATTTGAGSEMIGTLESFGAISLGADATWIGPLTSTGGAVGIGARATVMDSIVAFGAIAVAANAVTGDLTSTNSGAVTIGASANSGDIETNGTIDVGALAETGNLLSTNGAIGLGAGATVGTITTNGAITVGAGAIFCGDGITDVSEDCDGSDHCEADCTFSPRCGDGTIDEFEECDGGEYCNTDCTFQPYCGDDEIQEGEQCEPPDTAGCNAICIIDSVCGNNIVEYGEQCDPPGDTCSFNTCQTTSNGGGVQGDPHFKTWAGKRYDFHGECDLILFQSTKFKAGLGVDLHIRTTMRREMSYISSAALRIGTHVLEVQSKGVYYLNGVMGAAMPNKISGFPIAHSKPNKKQHAFHVDLGDGESIKIKTYKDFVSVTVDGAQSKDFGDSVGLMGALKRGLTLARDGSTVLLDHNAFGQEWQVLDTEPKIFQTARLPQHPQGCTMPLPAAKPSRLRRRLSESSVTELAAEKACAHWGEGKDDCVFDVLTTGDLEMAVVGAY
jgi:hypothetical protein